VFHVSICRNKALFQETKLKKAFPVVMALNFRLPVTVQVLPNWGIWRAADMALFACCTLTKLL